jgi:glycosyltransferase involved in cell wall biosynthesis
MALETARRSRLWQRPLEVASTQLVVDPGLDLLRGPVAGRLLDLHDHPRLQLEAFGIAVSPDTTQRLNRLVARNLDKFTQVAVPSASFASICNLPAGRTVVATNGTDTQHIIPGPEPGDPVFAMVSGAAPGRGIELLVEAADAVRLELPETRLRLALQPTGPASAAYLSDLRGRLRGMPWVTVESVPYASLSNFLAGAAVLAIPHPPHPYLDVATPVKLMDGMAAARPTVITPRRETAAIIERREAGLVAGGETADDLAAPILRLLTDSELRARLGASARRAAVEEFDWRIIARNLADAVLGPEAPNVAVSDASA